MFEIQSAIARALINTTKHSPAGSNRQRMGISCIGTRWLGIEHSAQYKPSSKIVATTSITPTNRTRVNAPRSGASMAVTG